MILLLKIVIISALIQLMRDMKPYWCALIYSLLVFVLSFFAGIPFQELIFYCPIVFIISLIYFWLLDKAVEGFLWWAIAIIGFLFLV